MKTSYVVLAIAAVGIARLVQSERQARQRLALHAEEIHQELISDAVSNPELRVMWTAPGELPDEEYREILHCNRLISLLSVKFRAGLLDRASLRVQARWLMAREVGRTYWATLGSFREEEAVDRIDRTFNAIMADEHAAMAAVDTVAT
ncbi:DUF6082 family protein [Streptomyces sp. NEAU-YJ-81]|uniref:DUF6082 family protein n=1 Tax=Streptomyces sp. NEAU-YJ-81 TaxID=2820288 RepID=UPI001ABCEB41|nr:DUF6082 family protein [Streptomyces sp. NEAU-YJ-81]MBO3681713.1 hypothetical protein [Streptomyces sp. NEAU-YJ-81]